MSGWTPTPSYWTGSVPHERHRITTSPTEVAHLSIAFIVLTIDIALVTGFLRFGLTPGSSTTSIFVGGLGFAVAAALTGFVAHEMAHKVAAQRHGFWAEFRFSPLGLLLSLVTAFAGFLFAAPGATVIGGMGSTREWGRTSLAGPALNLVEGTAFLAAGVGLWPVLHSYDAWWFFTLLAFINGWFAAFNLVPIGPLDGQKVFRWNRALWVVSFALAVVFTLGAYLVLGISPV